MVRSVMAVLVLIIFPGLMAGQEPVLEAPLRATLEAVVRFDYDEAAITAEADQLLREKLPILLNSPATSGFVSRVTPTSAARPSTTWLLEAGVPRVCGASSRALGFRRIGSLRPRLGKSGPSSVKATRRPGLRTVGSSS